VVEDGLEGPPVPAVTDVEEQPPDWESARGAGSSSGPCMSRCKTRCAPRRCSPESRRRAATLPRCRRTRVSSRPALSGSPSASLAPVKGWRCSCTASGNWCRMCPTVALCLGRPTLGGLSQAADLTQGQLGRSVICDRTTVAHIEKGRGRADERFWQAADRACHATGALLTAFHQLQTANRSTNSARGSRNSQRPCQSNPVPRRPARKRPAGRFGLAGSATAYRGQRT
jgi:DNA-binding XRE family transcriptional regulator